MLYNTVDSGVAFCCAAFSFYREVKCMGVSLVIVWLALAVVLGVIELSTMGLFTIWFAIGAVASMLAALLGASLLIQLIVF